MAYPWFHPGTSATLIRSLLPFCFFHSYPCSLPSFPSVFPLFLPSIPRAGRDIHSKFLTINIPRTSSWISGRSGERKGRDRKGREREVSTANKNSGYELDVVTFNHAEKSASERRIFLMHSTLHKYNPQKTIMLTGKQKDAAKYRQSVTFLKNAVVVILSNRSHFQCEITV